MLYHIISHHFTYFTAYRVKGLTIQSKGRDTAGGEEGRISVCSPGLAFLGCESSPLSGDSEELWPSNESVETLRSPSPSAKRLRPITVPLLLPLGGNISHFETQVDFLDLTIAHQSSNDSDKEMKYYDSYDEDGPCSPLGNSKNVNLFPVGSAMQFARNKH